MERKDYLKQGLSKEEKIYLKTLIINVRNRYIRKNYKFINNMFVEYSEMKITDSKSLLDTILYKFERELKSASEFEKIIYNNDKLYKIVGALSEKEKTMLFYLYYEEKEIKEVSKIMNISLATAYRRKEQLLNKIMKRLLKEERKCLIILI